MIPSACPEGATIMLLKKSPPGLVDQDGAVIPGGAAYLSDIERCLAPSFERAEPQQRTMASRRGLLSPAERKNSWKLGDVSSDVIPHGFQHLLRLTRSALHRWLHRHGINRLPEMEGDKSVRIKLK